MHKLCQGIEFGESENFYVKYKSPRRKIKSLREEFNIDAIEISKFYGPVYIGFSSGVDSQIITRCFLDNNLDCEFVFLHIKDINNIELERVIECEKFYGIEIKKYVLDIEEFKNDWINRSQTEIPRSMHQYQFEWLSNTLPNNFPIVMQGCTEPAIIGGWNKNPRSSEYNYPVPVSIYHNYHESSLQRKRLMEKLRPVIEFPFSPESVTSYYTENSFKNFCKNINYFIETDPTIPYLLNDINYLDHKLNYFNLFAKPFVKGEYFKDIIWHGKLTGHEMSPDWLKSDNHKKGTAIAVPYWDLVDFLENNLNQEKNYSSWLY
jgi:hypothetical protein